MSTDNTENPFGSPVEDGGDGMVRMGGLNDIENKFYVPAGLWEFRTVQADYGPSKNSGNPMITLTIACTGRKMSRAKLPAFDGEDETQAGKELKTYVTLTKAAAFKVDQMAKAFDLPIDDEGNLAFRPSQLVGLQLVCLLQDRMYEERAQSDIKTLMRHPDGPQP